MEILLIERDSKGFAMAQENDNQLGMMTYSIASEQLIIIDHTDVEAAYKGKDVGKKMLYKIVEMAREKKKRIIPLCPFAAKMFQKLDDIKDVLH
ncbi:GNAT family N-acetyltransferase [Flavobacterium geliluteum]|uniref:N-acetyltransferase n=1 Tax=Flavobacterium geliluteum TaxID=2816120 RepID=A0A940X5W3_9FLAO|nr:GNAT family N-acetyltransferase [Flavobacterium geliluteum]MBP4138378.1 N-acetyltransferase [Flavobacterium geliluteum]